MKNKTLFSFINEQFRYLDFGSAKYKQLSGLRKAMLSYCDDFKIDTLSYSFIRDFKAHISASKLSQNSKFAYWNVFKWLLKEAFKMKYIKDDLDKVAGSFQQGEVIKKHLNDTDVVTLSEYTPPMRKKSEEVFETVQDMAAIMRYTGLRVGDVQMLNLKENVLRDGNNTYIRFIQEKTGQIASIRIHDDIIPIFSKYTINEPFKSISYDTVRYFMKRWASGLSINTTPHTFRHTFAMKLRSNNVDILTISSLLGHKSLATTQNYLKASDCDRTNAVMGINY